jgi:serine/threonine protein kinase
LPFSGRGETVGELVAKVYIPPDTRDLDEQSYARFGNEVKLASTIRHPYVVPAIGSGTTQVGAYVLPYYLMPQASSTLRALAGTPPSADELPKLGRLFLQACLGVSCLHGHGVVHRDLKPENVLIGREGNAWIADLGIAHIDPDFVTVSLRTVAAEKLLNRDYYAPEQRFGTNADVDSRADIYALGCILYEMLSGNPPVRRDSPPVVSANSAFAALDPVIDRMTSYDADSLYQHVEAVIVDVAMALGWVTATTRGATRPAPADLKRMSTLLRSSNGANRAAGVDLAVALGTDALPELHERMGHGRREVRNSAATALGLMTDHRSLPFLVTGLYGNSKKASNFRPTIDTAADALARYPEEVRRTVLASLEDRVRPEQVITLVADFPVEAAFAAVADLANRKLLLLDWSETELEVLVEIDEAAAWPKVAAEAGRLGGWILSRLIPRLSVEHQLTLAEKWLDSERDDGWEIERMATTIIDIPANDDDLRPLLESVSERVAQAQGTLTRRGDLLGMIRQRLEA